MMLSFLISFQISHYPLHADLYSKLIHIHTCRKHHEIPMIEIWTSLRLKKIQTFFKSLHYKQLEDIQQTPLNQVHFNIHEFGITKNKNHNLCQIFSESSH